MSADILIDNVLYPTISANITDRNNVESLISLDGDRINLLNYPQTTHLSVSLAFSDLIKGGYSSAAVSDARALRDKFLSGVPITVEFDTFIDDSVICESCSLIIPPATQSTAILDCNFVIQYSRFLEPIQFSKSISIPSIPADVITYSKKSKSLISSVNKLAKGLQNLSTIIPQLNAATFGKIRGMIKNCIAAAQSYLSLLRQITPDAALLNAYKQTVGIINTLIDADLQAATLQQSTTGATTATFTVTTQMRVSAIAKLTNNSISTLAGLNPGLKSPVKPGTLVRYIP